MGSGCSRSPARPTELKGHGQAGQSREGLAFDSVPDVLMCPDEDRRIAELLGEREHPVEFAATVLKARILLKRRLEAAKVAQRTKYTRNGSAVALTRSSSLVTPEQVRLQVPREDDIAAGMRLLSQRLDFCGLKEARMGDDGNCQFRALSYQLFGTQDHHGHVRARACAHMLDRRSDFECFFEPGEFDGWVESMKQAMTWGDELTLRAAADAFLCTIHVIQSTEAHWHLVYHPSEGHAVRKLFVTYIAPIHYNCVERAFDG